jgi:hypothetical protein
VRGTITGGIARKRSTCSTGSLPPAPPPPFRPLIQAFSAASEVGARPCSLQPPTSKRSRKRRRRGSSRELFETLGRLVRGIRLAGTEHWIRPGPYGWKARPCRMWPSPQLRPVGQRAAYGTKPAPLVSAPSTQASPSGWRAGGTSSTMRSASSRASPKRDNSRERMRGLASPAALAADSVRASQRGCGSTHQRGRKRSYRPATGFSA